jgi:hypothetical protein
VRQTHGLLLQWVCVARCSASGSSNASGCQPTSVAMQVLGVGGGGVLV